MVNFGQRLRDELRREGWESKYIKYAVLKKILKKISKHELKANFTKSVKARQDFQKQLQEDIDQVDSFFQSRISFLLNDADRLLTQVEECLQTTDADVNILDMNSLTEQKDIALKNDDDDDDDDEEEEINLTGETKDTTGTTEVVAEVDGADDMLTEQKNTDQDELIPKKSKSQIARESIEGLVAFRRQVDAIVQYAYVNKEAVRKIVKKHDKNLTTVLDQPALMPEMMNVLQKTNFGNSVSNTTIMKAMEVVNNCRRKIQMKSVDFNTYYESLIRGGENDSNNEENNKKGMNNEDAIGDSPLLGVGGQKTKNGELSSASSSASSAVTKEASEFQIGECCFGYNLTLSRPDDYERMVAKRNREKRNECCGRNGCPLSSIDSIEKRQWYIFGIVLILIVLIGIVLAYIVQPKRTGTLVGLGVVGAIVLSFANGANDIANSMGVVTGAHALSLRQALVLGSIFEFLGAVTMGQTVAKTVSKSIINPTHYMEDGCHGTLQFSLGMLCVLLSAGITTLLATVYGLPISATHSIVGALVAVGLAAKGASSLGVTSIVSTIVAWVASPVLGALTAALVHVFISKSIFSAKDPIARSKCLRPLFVIIAVTVCTLFMFASGPLWIQIEPFGIAVLVSVIIGVCCSLALFMYENWIQAETTDCCPAWHYLIKTCINSICTSQEEKDRRKKSNKSKNASSNPNNSSSAGSLEDPEIEIQLTEVEKKAAQREGAEKPFVPLLILSGLVLAFAHGANDVGNAVGPLSVILETVNTGTLSPDATIPDWVVILCAFGFVFGIAFLGSRTIETVGGKIVSKLTPTKSFATHMGASAAILTSSVLGLPVSTSHCLVGAVIGIGAADRCLRGSGELNWSMLRKIFVGWAVTIPLAMFISVIIFGISSPGFFHSDLGSNTTTNGTLCQ
tara:strand:- start:146 stop:2875 length:2730 start_codon:yes stop_codon:yes gene_type:complete